MGEDRQSRTLDEIVRVVTELLESEGYDRIQLRVVAQRARVSLSTIYRSFPTRNELIVTALLRWMETHCYADLAHPPPDCSLYESQMWIFRRIFEPWEDSPRMLEAYYRARTGPGGERLDLQGASAVDDVARPVLDRADAGYAKDFALIVANLVSGVIERFAVGDLSIRDILPVIERTVFRLTTDNEALTTAQASRGRAVRRGRKGAIRR